MTTVTFEHKLSREKICVRTVGDRIVIDQDGYKGSCDFSVTQDALEIHIITAQPPGAGLGSILMFCTSLEAMFRGATKIETVATAKTAYDFYIRSGLLPENPMSDGKANYDLRDDAELDAFGMRVLGRYMSATWKGNASTVKNEVLAGLERKWEIIEITS